MGRKPKQNSAFPKIEEVDVSQVQAQDKLDLYWTKLPKDAESAKTWEPSAKAKERLREIIELPEFREKIGATGKKPLAFETDSVQKQTNDEPPVNVLIYLKPAGIVWIFDIYAVVLAFFVSTALKADFELAHNEIKFDDEQKKLLSEALSPVLMKYIPAEWLLYAPEIQLAMMLATVTGAKIGHAKQAIAKSKQVTDKKEPTPINSAVAK